MIPPEGDIRSAEVDESQGGLMVGPITEADRPLIYGHTHTLGLDG